MRGLFSITVLSLLLGAALAQYRGDTRRLSGFARNRLSAASGASSRMTGYGHHPEVLNRRRRVGNMLVGAHVCKERGHTFCCPGWSQGAGKNRCIVPECRKGACDPGGICYRPNVCFCRNLRFAPSCRDGPKFSNQKCMLRCMNGGSCVNNECSCADGFTGAHCAQPICGPGCLNGGRCVQPNKCICSYGFTGDRCQTDYRVGPCFLTRANDTCMDQVPGVACNKKLCCATIGQGWGSPCEECPARVKNCTRGRMPPNCDDINECDLIPGLCKDGTCVNTDGSFRCECPSGYTYNNRLHLCEDVNECTDLGYCENGECSNTVGGFMCKCPPDYRLSGDQTFCIFDAPGYCYTAIENQMCSSPLDRLTKRTDCCCSTLGGQRNQETLGKCFAVPGGQPEKCPSLGTPEFDRDCESQSMLGIMRPAPLSGAGGILDSLFPHPCVDDKAACGNGSCVKLKSIITTEWQCECNEGFVPKEPKLDACIVEYENTCVDGGSIVDYHICEMLGAMACGEHGVCTPVDGGGDYQCQCDEGFQQAPDLKSCIDINECGDGLGQRDICGQDGTCQNTLGSYTCHCDPGFKSGEDMIACIDVDECMQEGLCENGECINTKGSFRCGCNDGYRVTATQQGCEDYNECLENNELCENGRCLNIVGGFRCVCNPGFNTAEDLRSCHDVPECDDAGICEHGTCIDREGGFDCSCDNGYELTPDGRHCNDVDECEQKPCINGRCENVEGGFECYCHPFLELDHTGRRCVLSQRKANCYRNVRNGQCTEVNSLSVLTTRHECCCSVPGGLSAWDQCEPCPEDGSSDHGVLCNAPGGPVTIPNMCAMFMSPCVNGACINMAGNDYRCECNVGFVPGPDGKSCVDIDECHDNMMLCSNGECRNTPGSFACTCHGGFILRGDVCEDTDECASNPCTNGECINEPGGFRCKCDENSMLDINGLTCYDVQLQQCWRSFTNGTCQDNLPLALTVEECCNSVGVAWGNRDCRPCSEFDLRCPKGFRYDIANDECVDIPECTYGICDPEADCIETEGSYRCVCPPHLTLDATGTICVDLRVGTCFYDYEESTETCTNPTLGSVMRKADCCCEVGQGWGDPCEACPVDDTPEFDKLCPYGRGGGTGTGVVNQCILFPDLCANGLCENTVDGFICHCNNGYTLDETGRMCSDIPECLISPGLCGEGECVNTDGSFKCECEEGFTVNAAGDFCEDIIECNDGGRCTGGECHNTIGSYECVCPEGRSLSEDGSRCIDVDECSVMRDLCQPNGQCVNMLGYFLCVCNPGYVTTADQQSCVDLDECAQDNGGCSTICINSIGSYECRCEEGFSLTYDGHTCADIDECMELPNRCDGGRCENMEGTFRCVCFDGFMATMDLQYCEDIDECAMNPHICMNGKCHNTRGSYTCNCDQGYCVPQGQMICVDEDECELGKHTCDVNADCANTDGSFECTCIAGFYGDGYDCEDEDECVSANHTCDSNAFCENTHGSYACNCLDGFHGDGYTCSDKDDCLADDNLCGPHGTCLNIQGSFECECPMGFMTTPDKKACKDIDECGIRDICVNGKCHNVPGTFRCDCLSGFEKDEQGANCTDVDECEDVANCINGECVNSIGAYECQCPEGFDPNPTGVGCVDTRRGDCFLNVEDDGQSPVCSTPIGVGVSRSGCCCSYGQGWGNPCEICPEKNTTEFMTLCPGGEGFKPNPITVLLEDIDECMELPGVCQGGKCINVFGSFVCECREGYALNDANRVCEDVDECEAVDQVCGPGTCVNAIGGYSCLCPEGYKPINQGRICEDERQANCYRYYNESSLQCQEQLPFNVTKKLCCCTGQIGSGWNNPCEVCPIEGTDEFESLCGTRTYLPSLGMCARIPDLCLNGVCVDTDDGHRCECPGGYRYNEDLLICEDIDECTSESCFENARCVNMPGSFRCSCEDGFNKQGDACFDIDECVQDGACANGRCENIDGGFICDCNRGFIPINGDEACEDVDECEFEPCGPGTCQNMIGSYVCTCDNGFTLSDNDDCVDQNECEEDSVCRNGVCENERGGYTCLCDDGYKISLDGRACLDLNECMENSEVCGVGTCQNMDGSYKCFCPTGYSSPDDSSCIDDDECDLLDMCKFGECVNTPGSFHCVCPENFALSSNKKFCIDQRRGNCYNAYSNGQCSNAMPRQVTRGACCCRSESAAWGESGSCDECPAEGTDEFDDLCPGGYGFTPNGDDINECVENNPCVNGKCRNLAGGYKCECREGFVLDITGRICVDENECIERGNPCGPGTCTNREGGFECECETGYYNGPNMQCLDINECREGAHGCAFRCQNTDGSYICLCPDGFLLNEDERTCDDIDECSDPDLNRCEEKDMICKNQIGYFQCLCQTGYKKIGLSDVCENVNECEQKGVCAGGECIDLDGTYQCRCDEGYEYDEQGRRCIDRRQGLCYTAVHQRTCEITATTEIMVSKTECCCSKGAGWGMDCELCPHQSSKEYVKMCPHGPGFNERGEDIDDCVVTPGLCVNGTCTNLLGSYKCICDRGFMPTENMKECIDIDECMMPNGCAGGSMCINTFGGYKCECPAGYQITNAMRCVDIDECVKKDHACQFICINTIGSYDCGCPHGFVMHQNESCVDEDECATKDHVCGDYANCVNDVGGYHCVCKPGYEKNEDGDGCIGLPCDARPNICGNQMCMNVGNSIRCVPGCHPSSRLRFGTMRCYDIDDCRVNPCGMGQRCMPDRQNPNGKFKCTCGRGFAFMGSGGCNDINECQFQNSPCSFGCQNSFGGYQCGCPRGFFGLGGGHCMNGLRGFQQPRFPQQQYGGGMPYMGPPPMGGGRCYDCGSPMRRQRRSVEAVMEEISGDDENRPPVNTSVPVILSLSVTDLVPRQRLVRLLPALRALQDHTVYRITSGNEAGMFRIHKRDSVHFIHINRGFAAQEGPVIPGRYRIHVEAESTLDVEEAKRLSLDNRDVEKAMVDTVQFDVEFDIAK